MLPLATDVLLSFAAPHVVQLEVRAIADLSALCLEDQGTKLEVIVQ